MNCFYEMLASTFLNIRTRFIPRLDEDDLGDAEDTLESCRNSLLTREEAMALECTALGKEALTRRRAGDVQGAKVKLIERRRTQQRLDRLRTGLMMVDKQLDALRSSELDKELMQSLRLSSQAMKNAGIGSGLEDAEHVLSELDDQMREATEFTSVLTSPLTQMEEDDDIDVDAELGLVVREVEGVDPLGLPQRTDSMLSLQPLPLPAVYVHTLPPPPPPPSQSSLLENNSKLNSRRQPMDIASFHSNANMADF